VSDTVEKVLREGEELRFEARPRGWPPLTGLVFAIYAGAFLLLGIPELLVGPFMLGIAPVHGGTKIDVPFTFFAFPLALVALVELRRFTRHRSRIYAVTSERILVLEGIHRTRLRAAMALDTVRGVQLMGGEPAVVTSRFKYALTGLDQVDLESIRHALGDPPLLDPRPHGLVRRRFGAFAFVLLVGFVLSVEVLGLLERTRSADFRARWSAVQGALRTVQSSLDPKLQCTLNSSSAFSTNLVFLDRTTDDVEASGKGGGYAIRVSGERTFSSRIAVTVSELHAEPNNREFLDALRVELDKLGVCADWPAPR
jgi:hypothetical protein